MKHYYRKEHAPTEADRLADSVERRFGILICWVFIGMTVFILSVIGADKKVRDPYAWIILVHLAISAGLGLWLRQAILSLRRHQQNKRGAP